MNYFTRFFKRVKQMFVRPKHALALFRNAEYAPSGSLRDNEIVGGIANAIASAVGKLQPQLVRQDAAGTAIQGGKLTRLLCLRPCPEMSTYDFLYRMASDLVYTSNAFAVIFYTEDFLEVDRIVPVTVRSHRIVEDGEGQLFFSFVWDYDGAEYTVPYEFVIHLKGRYNRKRFLGTPPDSELKTATDLLEITYDGIRQVVQNSASLRGYLKYNNIADDEVIEEKVREFREAYLSSSNEGGIAGIDSTMDFHEISQQPRQVPIGQVSFFRENIYRYYGISEKILTGNYTETEWNSFYEAAIEPIAIQLSLEFTFKLLSERERGFGGKILFTANRLQYATLQTRASLGRDLFDRGIITINEYRALMYLPQIADGDVRQVSLNYVRADEQSIYQLGQSAATKEEDDDGQGGE